MLHVARLFCTWAFLSVGRLSALTEQSPIVAGVIVTVTAVFVVVVAISVAVVMCRLFCSVWDW